jgi:hypothetical protein
MASNSFCIITSGGKLGILGTFRDCDRANSCPLFCAKRSIRIPCDNVLVSTAMVGNSHVNILTEC